MILHVRRCRPLSGRILGTAVPSDIILAILNAPGCKLYASDRTEDIGIGCSQRIIGSVSIQIGRRNIHLRQRHINSRRRTAERHNSVSCCNIGMYLILPYGIAVIRHSYRRLIASVLLPLCVVPFDITLVLRTPYRYLDLLHSRHGRHVSDRNIKDSFALVISA